METVLHHAVLPTPTFASPPAAPLPARCRARLWLPGRVFGPTEDQPRLWLILADGRVLAFRLPKVTLGGDAVIAPLVDAAALLALISTLLFAAGMTPRQRRTAAATLREIQAAAAQTEAQTPQPAVRKHDWVWPLIIGLWIGNAWGDD